MGRRNDYSLEQHGDTERNNSFGNDFVYKQSGPAVRTYRPHNSVPFIMRPWPTLDDDREEFLPYRHGIGKNQMTDWVRAYSTIRFAGQSSEGFTSEFDFSCIAYNPRDIETKGDLKTWHPYEILVTKLQRAIDTGACKHGSWTALRPRRMDQPLPNISQTAFLQGAVYQAAKKKKGSMVKQIYVQGGFVPAGLAEDDRPPIIQLTGSAYKAMMHVLNERNETIVEGDIAKTMKYGDPVRLSMGRFLKFYIDADTPEANQEAHTGQLRTGRREEAGGGRGGDDGTIKPYKCDVLAKIRLAGMDLTPRMVDYKNIIKERVVFFDDLLHVPTIEELTRWIAMAYGSVPKFLDWAWVDHRSFFTDEVKGILAHRKTVAMGGSDTDEGDDAPPARGNRSRGAQPPEDDNHAWPNEDEENEISAAGVDDDEPADEVPAPKGKGKDKPKPKAETVAEETEVLDEESDAAEEDTESGDEPEEDVDSVEESLAAEDELPDADEDLDEEPVEDESPAEDEVSFNDGEEDEEEDEEEDPEEASRRAAKAGTTAAKVVTRPDTKSKKDAAAPAAKTMEDVEAEMDQVLANASKNAAARTKPVPPPPAKKPGKK